MKRTSLWLALAALSVTFTACSKTESPVPPRIEIPAEFTSVSLDEGKKTQEITFEAGSAWTVSIDDQETKAGETSWLTVSPLNGPAGKATLTITAGDSYLTTARTAYVHIEIDGQSQSIAVTQTPGFPELADDQAAEPVAAGGFYVANEDWFGHDNGTVNYFLKNGTAYEPSYRVYRAANDGAELGVTTQFATIWGDYVYFCSKQGNRFVVADAKTMKQKAVFPTIGGDGRSFVGVNDTVGYIGHGNGIVAFDIANMQLGQAVEGVTGQVGSMCLASGRVFAITQKNGLVIIDAATNKVESTVAGTYNTLTRSKDGDVWVAGANKLIRYNPATLETEEIDYPDGAKVGSSWGAWNAGSLCASTQKNVLYWTNGTKVVKFDVDTRTANTAIYTLGTSESGKQLAFYGAALRVDPLTDELILTVKHSGWGDAGAYNWIYKLNADGQEVTHFAVKGDNGSGLSWAGNADTWDGKYFWFPAMPFFEDANKPQILLNQILLTAGEEKTVDLTDKIVDYDNTAASIQKSVVFSEDGLATGVLEGNTLTIKAGDQPGSTTLTLRAVSNGVPVEKSVRVDIKSE